MRDSDRRAPAPLVEVQVDEPFQERAPSELLRRAAQMTLAFCQVSESVELAVVVTEDGALQELNRRYRGVDAPTDVLAFPNETRGPFVSIPGAARYLGDVIISFPRAEAQALERGHPVLEELQLLVVHGVLHLLGYDDQEEMERTRMWEAQIDILHALGVDMTLVGRGDGA